MAALIFLALGLVCILIGRVLLIRAAFGVSVGWGFGIFLPFGPFLFRLSYPDLAPLSRTFRLIALPCFLAYFALRPGPLSASTLDQFFKQKEVPSAPANHYGLEKISKAIVAPTVDQRRAINATELERLTAWSQTLRLKKRDLLHSDVQGNLAYNAEVVEYNVAVTKATAEKNALWPQKK